MQHWLRQARNSRREGSPEAVSHPVRGPLPLVGAGCGSFLVRALAQATQRAYLSFDTLVDAPPDLRGWANVCAPAVAVAILREQACRSRP